MIISSGEEIADVTKLAPCLQDRHIRFEDEPSLGLSDADFVHRMWDSDEDLASDDEDSEDDSSLFEGSNGDDDDDEKSAVFGSGPGSQSARPIWKYFTQSK